MATYLQPSPCATAELRNGNFKPFSASAGSETTQSHPLPRFGGFPLSISIQIKLGKKQIISLYVSKPTYVCNQGGQTSCVELHTKIFMWPRATSSQLQNHPPAPQPLESSGFLLSPQLRAKDPPESAGLAEAVATVCGALQQHPALLPCRI